MGKSLDQVIEDDGEGLSLQGAVDNKGWSNPRPTLSFSSRRARRPPPLQLSSTRAIIEGTGTPKNVKPRRRLPEPASDLGLGYVGGPSQIAEAGHGERTNGTLRRTDYHRTKTAQELLDGGVWSDGEGPGFQTKGSPDEESDSSADVSDEGECYESACESMSDDSSQQALLEELDNLEAARPRPEEERPRPEEERPRPEEERPRPEEERPRPEEERITIPGGREDIWEKPDFGHVSPAFDSWADEAAALEESASMPDGTRYYQVKDSEESV
ncbi:hypothetical protein SAMD00023353_2500950 [Rosellinia necatrix]|uniref:Uncharacterized protein n=1 Tax=Rosellinia necatrix TaxID=77044 RepID=A0A1W2TG32_ROSNE|nr:hypothetical protein SAMD00023353_2500950 [Rosellinia necatrix]